MPVILLLGLLAGLGAVEVPIGPLVDGEGVQVEHMTLLDMDFHDVVTSPQIADGVLTLGNLGARAYGGQVTGSMTVSLQKGDINLALDVRDLRLGTFLQGYVGIDGYDGIIDGHLELHLPQGTWSKATGRGTLRLRGGRVIQAPGLAKLLFGDPGAVDGRDRGWASFTIKKGVIRFEQAVIDNDSFHVLVKGQILAKGGLDLQISPFAKLDHFGMLPGIGDLAGFLLSRLTGRIARFDVTGHISNPQLSSDPF